MIESVRNITKFLYNHAYVLNLMGKLKGNKELVCFLLLDNLDTTCVYSMSPDLFTLFLLYRLYLILYILIQPIFSFYLSTHICN